ncbi:MAG TPA: TspO/MBR family protein [Gemmatimonadaceae bacterium]|nr:TspO/MBR family protein [Gemmatimonadaceae bacterium]
MTARSIPALIGWVAAVFLTAAIASIPSTAAYLALDLPPWAPPSSVFGPVWTVLYVLMGIAAWLVWGERHHAPVGTALGLFIAQLVLNALWTWIFFGYGAFGLAAIEIVVLWVVLLATTIQFWRIRPAAGALLVPYLVWVAYAGALTMAIWASN